MNIYATKQNLNPISDVVRPFLIAALLLSIGALPVLLWG